MDRVCSRATGAKGLAGTAYAARRSLCDLLGGLPAVEMGDYGWIGEARFSLRWFRGSRRDRTKNKPRGLRGFSYSGDLELHPNYSVFSAFNSELIKLSCSSICFCLVLSFASLTPSIRFVRSPPWAIA